MLFERKLTAGELDEFMDTFVDIIVEGHRSNGAFHFGPLKTSRHTSALNSILRFRVDPELDRWTTFNERAQRFFTLPPIRIAEQLLSDMDEMIEERIRQLPSVDIERPTGTLSAEEQREAHERTLAAQDRFEDRLKALFEPWNELREKERRADIQVQIDEKLAKIAEIEASVRMVETAARNRPAPAPAPQPYGVSPRGAELLVTDWMRHIGILDAYVTPEHADGGVDVSSATHLAQVKHYTGKVSVVELRELFGVAMARGKQGLFFTSNGYTADALTFAKMTNLPLFVYNAEQGSLRGITTEAQALLAS
jgi:Restriction endonuclease